ncbi:MAG: hypothetical protein L6Q37_00365 [Bdellovibrionaceae bacterium]|nr:hypothetical protein [Pseudobdellovibrionaceae bacterium]NUM58871.1 hypothetical protein [Pseudobdellovibrionaceae bacterium]
MIKLPEKKVISKCIEEFELQTQIEFKLIIEKKAANYSEIIYTLLLVFVFIFWGAVHFFDADFDFNVIYLEALFLVVFNYLFLSKFLVIQYFLPDSLKLRKAKERALFLFAREKIYRTKLRSGMLLYYSKLEKKGIFIVDEGVKEKINPDQLEFWQAEFNRSINSENFIEELGAFIRTFGVFCHRIWPDETFTNELSNEVLGK